MQFTLTYEGVLLGASRTDTRARHKHEIRKKFHPQLKHLWLTTSPLVGRKNYPLLKWRYDANGPETFNGDKTPTPWDQYLAGQFSQYGFRFVPLVVEELTLSCRLDILFLRWDRPGSLIRSGDIDNRLKTLFDVLRIPNNEAELGGCAPSYGEDPFYCLLQDDKLISHIALETDVFHEPVSPTYDENDARLVIRVTVRPMHINVLTHDFL